MGRKGVKPNYLRRIEGADRLIARMKTVFQSHAHFNGIALRSEKEKEYRDNAHIYMLCTRQKARVTAGSVHKTTDQFGNQSVAGLLNIYDHQKIKMVPFEADLHEIADELLSELGISSADVSIGDTRVVEVADNSFLNLAVFGVLKDGRPFENIRTVELNGFSRYFRWYIPEIQDLKIEYIGMATGTIEARSASERLEEGHRQLTKLNAEAMMRGDMDVIALYLDYDATLVGSNRPEHIPMPSPNIVEIIEGALISHFLPRLNTDGILRFPHKQPRRDDIIRLGLRHMEVSVNGDDCSLRVYSDAIPKTEFAVTVHEFDDNGVGHASRDNTASAFYMPLRQNAAKQLEMLERREKDIRRAEVQEGALSRSLGLLKRWFALTSQESAGQPTASDDIRKPILDTELILQALRKAAGPAVTYCLACMKLAEKCDEQDNLLFKDAQQFLTNLQSQLRNLHIEAEGLLRIAIQDVHLKSTLQLKSKDLTVTPGIVSDALRSKISRDHAVNFTARLNRLRPDINVTEAIEEISTARLTEWNSIRRTHEAAVSHPVTKPPLIESPKSCELSKRFQPTPPTASFRPR